MEDAEEVAVPECDDVAGDVTGTVDDADEVGIEDGVEEVREGAGKDSDALEEATLQNFCDKPSADERLDGHWADMQSTSAFSKDVTFALLQKQFGSATLSHPVAATAISRHCETQVE